MHDNHHAWEELSPSEAVSDAIPALRIPLERLSRPQWES